MTTTIDDVEDITPRIQYSASSLQVSFDYPFPIFEAEDLVVVCNGATMALGTDYSVSGAGNDTGGTVTFLVGRVLNDVVTIYRDIAVARTTDFPQNGPLASAAFNAELDRMTMIEQQLEAATKRAIRLPITAAVADSDLELLPSAWANKIMAFDSNAKPIPGTVSSTVMTQDTLGQLESPRTQTEINLGYVPTFYTYKVSPKVDPRRYGARGDFNGSSGTDDTTAMQRALNVAYANKGRVIIPDNFNSWCGALSVTMSGNRLTQSLAIEGMGPVGSIITQKGSPAQLLTLTGSTPTGNPSEAPLILENFSLAGAGKTTHGVTLDGISYWRVSGVHARGFDRGFNLQSALAGSIDQGCQPGENNYGIYARKHGAGSGCNQIAVKECQINLNSKVGLDIGSGINWLFQALDIEANGTAADLTTGGMFIRSTIDDDIGFSVVTLDSVWLEQNFGYTFFVESAGGLKIAIRGGNKLSAEGFREIMIVGADTVSIEDTFSPGGGGDTWDITCSDLFLKNVRVTTLTDTGVVRPTYHAARTATQNHYNGREDSFVCTLTGCTTVQTGTLFVNQQGDEITVETRAGIVATSNSNAATITGLPARYWPSAARTIIFPTVDNNVLGYSQCSVGTNGVITLTKLSDAAGFTSTGVKGVSSGRAKYKL